ncbi:uncharacterized protein MONOS_13762 [Monocercomonoides exilis]|uniref:uncharacterized protein n=1 Tax=Monocercomonoides exilis TaxID=2049356 RepID=UPI00355A8194|nr:hypothetical protein MONOS_13762 [Monocercomonoides exilis]|eukprot:MONOS_13762.1-p1 / transcript=MONOS_13762.1 / gene=MONOS_13762 / organism=Monocercomonoides_exilis_PA203 / gene_product=unspecified product / transcript_product=unspecified product / location=Mono_scaffold00878:20313-20549(-) / protein_length=79 / sequence_SO=supercontig / SO=protein_coding / is_pseudo=false
MDDKKQQALPKQHLSKESAEKRRKKQNKKDVSIEKVALPVEDNEDVEDDVKVIAIVIVISIVGRHLLRFHCVVEEHLN